MSRCWDMPLLPRSPPYTYTCGAALLTTGKVDVTCLFHSYFYSARNLTWHLFFLLQTPLPATQITVGCRDLQHLQQCFFRPLVLITQVCQSSWFDIHVEWHLIKWPYMGVFLCYILQDHTRWGRSVPVRQGQCHLRQSGTWYVSNDGDLKETNRTLTRVCFWLGYRLCASGGHGDSGAQDHCCQTWSRWKAGKKIIIIIKKSHQMAHLKC